MNAQKDFPLELDHVVVIVRIDAPEAETLEKIGLVRFGGTTKHGDLGTASTSFFFQNGYLELLWAYDGELAQKNLALVDLDLDARARWQDTFASPFGLMLRRKAGCTAPTPFATKKLKADWMPAETWIDFGAGNSSEPYYGIVPENLNYLSFYDQIRVKEHPLGIKKVTNVCFNIYGDGELSPIARLLAQNGVAQIEPAPYANLELEFDHGAQGEAINVRPDLPLVVKC